MSEPSQNEYQPRKNQLCNLADNAAWLVQMGQQELDKNPASSPLKNQRRWQLTRMGEAAVRLKQELETANPSQLLSEKLLARALGLRGAAYLLAGQVEAATTDLQSALALDPLNGQTWHSQAGLYYLQRNYSQALAAYDRAVELNPQEAETLYERAGLLYQQGQYLAAAADYKQALSLNPYHRFSHYGYSLALFQAGQRDQALGLLKALVDREPANPDNLYYLGLLLGYDKNYRQALRSFTRLLTLDPNYAPAYIQRAGAYLKILNGSLALKDFEQALRLDPTNPDYWYNRAETRYRFYRSSQALEDCKQCLALAPNYAPAYNLMGRVYAAKGQSARARAAFKRGAELDPANAVEIVATTDPTRPVSLKIVLGLVVAELGIVAGFNWPVTRPLLANLLDSLTGGGSFSISPVWLSATLQTVVVLGLLFGLTRLKLLDLGLNWKTAWKGIVPVVLIWAIIQYGNYLEACRRCGGAELDPDWQRAGPAWVLANFIFIALAGAILEQIFFTGFLLRQLSLHFKGPWRYFNALVVSQALLALEHLPLQLFYPKGDLVPRLFVEFMTGIFLGCLFLWSGNLFFTIGVSTLFFNSLPLFTPYGDNYNKLLLILLVVVNIWAQFLPLKTIRQERLPNKVVLNGQEGYRPLPRPLLLFATYVDWGLFMLYGLSEGSIRSTMIPAQISLLALAFILQGGWYLWNKLMPAPALSESSEPNTG